MSYDGPERRNGTSLEKVHQAILKNQDKLEEVRAEQAGTRVHVQAIKDNLRRGERRFDDLDHRVRNTEREITRAGTEIGNLKAQARKSGGMAGGATGGLAGGMIAIAWQFVKSAFKGG